MVVRAKTLPNEAAREEADRVSRAQPNAFPRHGVTSYTREYMEYFAPLLEEKA